MRQRAWLIKGFSTTAQGVRMWDIAIIGGGVNGCGIARDAAGRGLSVLLAEMGDLASGTSSASTKLIHGGLRYLEQYEFRLVREALREREVLLRMAPHIIRPMRFVLPHHRGLRPAFMIRLGLFLYDHLGGREILPPSTAVDLTRAPAGQPLKPDITRGFVYSDCSVDDARLVVLNAMDAAARGADVRVRTEVMSARRIADRWQLDLRDIRSGQRQLVEARAVVNAAGAWADRLAAGGIETSSSLRVRLVKGSHLVVPKLFEHDSAYIFQNADRRVVFAIPFERDFTLIGTTDVDFDGNLAQATISEQEIVYLCNAVNAYFAKPVTPADVVWSYAGVRSLYDEGSVSAQEATRDFVLELQGSPPEPPLLSVIGGKITTYRHLAEEALEKLSAWFPKAGGPWTAGSVLPGGDFRHDERDRLAHDIQVEFPFLGEATATRFARAYGTLTHRMLAGARSTDDLGMHFGAGLYEREVAHLMQHEWAMTVDDVLWRRTKLGLHMTSPQRANLQQWLAQRVSSGTTSAA
jgi:glycerol-3-phosphate dehydrogenase